MHTSPNGLVDIQSLCQLAGPIQIYLNDLNNNVLSCNVTQFEILKDVFGVDKNNVIGNSARDILKLKCSDIVVRSVCEENEAVIRSKAVQQFHNIWLAKGIYLAEFLTIKIPTYTNQGKLAGVMGVSYHLNKFSFKTASKFGLTPRESECLIYILEGKTYKQIAGLLDISVRTIEDYIDNVKRKLGCFRKSDLISKARQLQITTTLSVGIASQSTRGTENSLVLLNHNTLHSNAYPLRKWPEIMKLNTAESCMQEGLITLYTL